MQKTKAKKQKPNKKRQKETGIRKILFVNSALW